MTVNVVNTGIFPLPEYAHKHDAGMDLKANIDTPITINPGERILISTGIHTNIPEGYYVEIKPRSGLAYKSGLMAIIGVIDANYTGDWKVNLINIGSVPQTIYPGNRIAQAIMFKYETIEWNQVEELDDTDRGENGFGSSGIKGN